MNFFSNVLGATCASVIALGVSSVNAADMYQVGGLKDGVAENRLWPDFMLVLTGADHRR